MSIRIGNAPCSWGVEFADDPRNPLWETVLDECVIAGYNGIELGPVGFMPEDPFILGDALAKRDLALIGGVVFQPFHDPAKWDDVKNASIRTCKALVGHGARHFVLIDSISPRRASTAGRAEEAEVMLDVEWQGFVQRFNHIARMGSEEYGLTVSIHPHAAGFIDFQIEIERLLAEVDEKYLKLCLDTGHSHYAGFDPVGFMGMYRSRLSYVHFKDIEPNVLNDVVAKRTGFYEACAQGIFCNLGKGMCDFNDVRSLLSDIGYEGWITVEQDCDPAGPTSPVSDATANRNYLTSIYFT